MTEVQSPREYLLECCALDAAHSPQEILDARRARRGVEPEDEQGEPVPVVDRADLLQSITRVVTSFPTLTDEELVEQVEGLEPRGYADLEAYVLRLKRVLELRPRLAQARGDKALETSFLDRYEESLCFRGKERLQFKQKLVRHYLVGKHRRRSLRTIRGLREDYPELFDLDRGWLGEQLLPVQKKAQKAGWPQFVVRFFIVMLGLRVIVALYKRFGLE